MFGRKPTPPRSSSTTAVRAGGPARVALQVSLPETFHVQSNKPRDPSLIATELSIDAPAGVTVEEVVFPAATDLKQAGSDQPLAVFPHAFDIGVRLAIAGDGGARRRQRPASSPLPGLRRSRVLSARDGRVRGGRFTWCRRAPPSAPAGYRSVFDKIAFGHGEAPAATVAVAKPPRHARGYRRHTGSSSLDRFTVLGTDRRLPRPRRLPQFHSQRGIRRQAARACSRDADRSRSC